ncbi:MAG: site-specific integrase [Clostridia bacterium]
MASIQKRGNSWLITVDVGRDSKGKRIRKTKTVHAANKREAEKEAAKFQIEVDADEYIAPEKMSFSAFAEEWKSKYGDKHLSPKTLETYMFNLKNHILPEFGHLRIDQLKPFHILSLLEKLEQDGARKDGKQGGLSSASIRFVHRVLNDILARAVDWKIIKNNPVTSTKRPKVQNKEAVVYDAKEAAEVFAALENEPIMWRLMITLALTTALRRGELLGLEWKHMDLEGGIIEVKQSMSYVDGEHILKEPKTKNAQRKVSLPPSIIADLKAYKIQKSKQRLELGDLWEGGGHFFVFSADNGNPLYPTSPGKWFRRFQKRHNLKQIRFHDLRPTSATLLINQGVHAKTISSRLGHADIRTTMNIYGHALQAADQEAAKHFDSFIQPKMKSK